MQDNINILNELQEAGSTVLINMERQNVYSVPANYFNDFSKNLLSIVFVESIQPDNLYSVPAGYFEHLPELILEKLHIKKDFEDINAAKMPYAVPKGYFDDLATNILRKIKSDTDKTVQEELEEIAPFLSSIPRTNVYSVPAGYFNELSPFKEQTQKPVAKVIALGGKTRKWFNYAAAACISAVLIGGGYLYMSNTGKQVTRQPVIAETKGIDIQKGISELSDSEIADYLSTENNIEIYTSQSSDDQHDFNIQTLLENTSDEEIEDYLNKNAEPEAKKGGI